jgi:hypothetical protein
MAEIQRSRMTGRGSKPGSGSRARPDFECAKGQPQMSYALDAKHLIQAYYSIGGAIEWSCAMQRKIGKQIGFQKKAAQSGRYEY